MKSGVPIFPTLIFIIIIILHSKSRGGGREIKSGGDIPGVPPLCIIPCKAYLVYELPD